MHPRCICHSDLHFDNILVSKSQSVYTTYTEKKVTETEFTQNKDYHRDIADIKVIIIDFGKGIIVKNRFETYKDYFDVETLLKKLWFGEEVGNSVGWNSATQEFEWLLSEKEKVNLDLVGDMDKVRIMQTLLSSFMKIKKGMQHLYENNCESQEFRDYRILLRKQEKGRRQQEKEDKKFAANMAENQAMGKDVEQIGAQGDTTKHMIEVGVKGYNKEVGPMVLTPGDRITKRVDESNLSGYDLKQRITGQPYDLKEVDNAQQYSFKHVGEIINKYQTDMAKLKKR